MVDLVEINGAHAGGVDRVVELGVERRNFVLEYAGSAARFFGDEGNGRVECFGGVFKRCQKPLCVDLGRTFGHIGRHCKVS